MCPGLLGGGPGSRDQALPGMSPGRTGLHDLEQRHPGVPWDRVRPRRPSPPAPLPCCRPLSAPVGSSSSCG